MFRKMTMGLMVLVLAVMGVGLTGCGGDEPAESNMTTEEQIEKAKTDAQAAGEAAAAGAAEKAAEMSEQAERLQEGGE